jgi:uncharacterized membrane protein YgaE (UPF0421/DUF939 family)
MEFVPYIRRMNPAALFTTARRRLSPRAMAILKSAAAATAAWYLAALVTSDPQPIFASIAAIVTLGVSHDQHRQRALQLAGGVVLGLTLADLIIQVIGTGAPQIAVMVVLAMSVAVLLGGSEMVAGEAAVSAILLIALDPGAGYSPNRILEAVIGGGIALLVGALLFPPDPALQVGRAAQTVFGELGRALERTAAALATGDAGSGERALAEARAIDTHFDELESALDAGLDITRTAPQRFAARTDIARYERSLRHLDHAVRNTRVLARHAVRAVRTGTVTPADLPFAVSELAEAVWELAGAYEDPERAWAARDLASRAAARATRLGSAADLALIEILAQVRSTAVDPMRAAELVAGSPDELPTEELVALPRRDDAHVDLGQGAQDPEHQRL